jgi:hypothetical protein
MSAPSSCLNHLLKYLHIVGCISTYELGRELMNTQFVARSTTSVVVELNECAVTTQPWVSLHSHQPFFLVTLSLNPLPLAPTILVSVIEQVFLSVHLRAVWVCTEDSMSKVQGNQKWDFCHLGRDCREGERSHHVRASPARLVVPLQKNKTQGKCSALLPKLCLVLPIFKKLFLRTETLPCSFLLFTAFDYTQTKHLANICKISQW